MGSKLIYVKDLFFRNQSKNSTEIVFDMPLNAQFNAINRKTLFVFKDQPFYSSTLSAFDFNCLFDTTKASMGACQARRNVNP